MVMFFKRRKPGPESPSTPVVQSPAPTSTTDAGLSAIVEASRRISALRSRDEIVRQAVREAVAMTQAEVGAFLAAREDAGGVLRFAYQSHPELFAGSELTSDVLLAAIDARKSECAILEDESAILTSPVSVALAPAVGGGRMVGMIMVIRSADDAFGASAIEVLDLLGPVTGASLANAKDRPREELDDVTRLANRRRLDQDIIDHSRSGRIGFASIRVDQLPLFAETHTPEQTDELLRQIALTVRASIRPTDVAYRLDRDEFAILLPGATRVQAAWVAERVRQAIAAVALAELGGLDFTASIGVSCGEHDDPQELAERARSARLEAEELGQDRVVTDEHA